MTTQIKKWLFYMWINIKDKFWKIHTNEIININNVLIILKNVFV